MTGTFYQSFRVFISSPGDVREERRMAEEEIQNVSISCRDTLGISVECIKWEHLPPVIQPAGVRTQDVINEELVRACNYFVLILNKRWGSVEAGQDKSNTEREVETALKMLERGSRITFLCYFRKTDRNPDPGPQERKLEELKQRLLEGGKGLVSDYTDPADFRRQFTHDLYHTILKFRFSTEKRKALSAFWRFGVAEGDSQPRLAIVYPPLERSYMSSMDPDRIWLKRLIPYIVYEDYRVIQKIDKTLRLIGFSEFSAFTTPCIPADIQDQNRVWICLPRNRPGLAQLRKYANVACFRIQPGVPRKEGKILWRGPAGDEIEVQSPLVDYLTVQRGEHPGGEWIRQHSRIVAKDYAVLARFSDRSDLRPTVSGTLKDYFVGGIHGLGTWGVGWFIDRRYNLLQKHAQEEDSPVQLLLEVTYRDERIVDVRDVSGEPASYFRSENNLATVKRRVSEFEQQLT